MHRRALVAFAGAYSIFATLPLAPALAADDAGDVLKGYLMAWNAHDGAAAAAYFADDIVYFDASVGTPIRGKAEARAGVIDNFLNAAPDAMWITKGKPTISGGRVAFEWDFSGTNTGPWANGTPATNRPFRFSGATVLEVEHGKITLQSDYYDVLDLYRQLGLI